MNMQIFLNIRNQFLYEIESFNSRFGEKTTLADWVDESAVTEMEGDEELQKKFKQAWTSSRRKAKRMKAKAKAKLQAKPSSGVQPSAPKV